MWSDAVSVEVAAAIATLSRKTGNHAPKFSGPRANSPVSVLSRTAERVGNAYGVVRATNVHKRRRGDGRAAGGGESSRDRLLGVRYPLEQPADTVHLSLH